MPNGRTITITVQEGQQFDQCAGAVAKVDADLCVNCGKCRNLCPTDTIDEFQRDICRLCPDCADSPTQFPEESKRYAPKHACSLACPLGTVPEGYINLIAEGKLELAYGLARDLNPLPVVCSMICHHPCEDECKRGLLIDEPIAIRALKRFLTEEVEAPELKFNQRYDRKIAVIGAGPAGLTAAADLAKKGYRVKIFEAGPAPGGMMRKGIPDFRIDKDDMLDEIEELLDAGIEIEYECMVGLKPSINDLLDDKFEAVLIATGAGQGSKLPIPGANAEKVYDAVAFMNRVNSRMPVDVGKQAVVIGGGSVAMDTARTLRRLGVDDVTCAFVETLECEKEGDVPAPAPLWEIDEAREEGVIIVGSSAPVRIVADWFTVQGVEFQKVKEITCDDNGLKFECEPGSEFTLDADTVVFATGQKADVKTMAERNGLELADSGALKFDEGTMATSNPRVFVAGDVVAARGSVIDAMAAGRKAALSIDNLLQNREITSRIHAKEAKTAPMNEKIYPATHIEKTDPQAVPKDRFRDSFDLVEDVFDEYSAMLEARRCMKCGYSGVDAEKCIGCGVCAEACPENAITLVQADSI